MDYLGGYVLKMGDLFWWIASIIVISIILMFSVIGLVTTVGWVVELLLG